MPRLSVIIPVYNDPSGIRDTLESILQQSLTPSAYEIIVVDNGSTDGTLEAVSHYLTRCSGQLNLQVENAIRGSYAARNRGINVAQGEICAFLDSDVTVPFDYLQKVSDYLANYDYIGCRVKVVPTSSSIAAKYDAIHSFRTDIYFERDRFVPTCCLSVRRSLIDRVGPFDARLESGGDREFAMRADEVGAHKGFATDICVAHPARTSLKALKSKRMRLGRGAAQRTHLDPARFGSREFRVWDYLPSNPLRIKRDAESRGLSVSVLEMVLMSTFKVPLTWAYRSSFARESRRLRAESGNGPSASFL